jgi:2-polyprenyl-3-methyl-5-hydroxy-6-metoxy-1,4-benzoquinol methylase
MIYANPVPSEYASGQYYDTTGADYYLTPAKLESDYADVRFQRELRLFREHCAGGAVLDVGCSSGGFVYQLSKRFPGKYEILGLDPSGPALNYAASRGVRVLQGDFLDHDFSSRRFDAVTFWAVLEHLFEPKRFLEKAWAILKPGGVCYVLVPNMKSLAVRLLGPRYRYIYPQHLNYFAAGTLTRLVQSHFSIAEFRSTHFNPVVIWQDWLAGGREISNQERAELLQRTTAYKQNPLLKPAKLFYGFSEKCLAALNLADNLAVVLIKRSSIDEVPGQPSGTPAG